MEELLQEGKRGETHCVSLRSHKVPTHYSGAVSRNITVGSVWPPALNDPFLLLPRSTRADPLTKELVAGSLGKNASAEGMAAAAVQTATLELAATTVLDKRVKPDDSPCFLIWSF